MNILFTNYIFALKKSISLSECLQIQLDNPRSKDEIKLVRNNISDSLSRDTLSNSAIKISHKDQVLLLQKYLKNVDDYNKGTIIANEDFLDYLSRCWIIVRFNCENPDALDSQQLKMKK